MSKTMLWDCLFCPNKVQRYFIFLPYKAVFPQPKLAYVTFNKSTIFFWPLSYCLTKIYIFRGQKSLKNKKQKTSDISKNT